MRRDSLTAVVLVASAAGCAKQESTPQDTTKNPATARAASGGAATATKLGETTGMKTPESVRYDRDLDVYFVSNVNGNPSQHDGNGFIAVVRADSTSVVKMLAESGKNAVTLDAPKGLAVTGDTLWVADIDVVRRFNKRTGASLGAVSLTGQKATFLNDVAVGPDGAIYVTDTGIAFDASGGTTHPGVDRIFRVAGNTVTEVARGDSLSNPNGITWDKANNRWLLAPSGGKDVQTMKPGDKNPTKLATGAGQYDGIEVLADGRVLVSSWADNAVHVIQNGQMSTLVANVSGPADIGVDTKRNVLAIPRFNDNKVEYYRIP